MVAVHVKLGRALNGHEGIVHGGVTSLLFDEAMGWAYESLLMDDDPNAVAVTANLTIDFRAPLVEGSEGTVRVYHDGTAGRKLHFYARLESVDGSVLYSEARSVFVVIKPKPPDGTNGK